MMRIFAFCLVLLISSCTISEDKPSEKSVIVTLSQAIEKDPNNINLLLERALYNNERNNFESALFDLKQCIALDSLNGKYQFSVADIYFRLSKLPNANSKYPGLAKHHLEKALKIDNEDYKSHALLGELLLAYAKYNEAIKHLNTSLKIEYNQAKTHMLLGYTFKQLQHEEQAINCFRNAINVNPEYKEAYVQLGQIYHFKKDTLAVVYYNNALSIDNRDELVLYNKAVFYQSLLDWNKALEAYADLHKINPFHTSGHYNLGFIHMELGLHNVATNNFSDAIYSDPEFYEAYYSRGSCFETLGNIVQAESDYKRAIKLNPEYTFAIEALEQLIHKNKNYNK